MSLLSHFPSPAILCMFVSLIFARPHHGNKPAAAVAHCCEVGRL